MPVIVLTGRIGAFDIGFQEGVVIDVVRFQALNKSYCVVASPSHPFVVVPDQ